jgi:hypothetical protein
MMHTGYGGLAKAGMWGSCYAYTLKANVKGYHKLLFLWAGLRPILLIYPAVLCRFRRNVIIQTPQKLYFFTTKDRLMKQQGSNPAVGLCKASTQKALCNKGIGADVKSSQYAALTTSNVHQLTHLHSALACNSQR